MRQFARLSGLLISILLISGTLDGQPVSFGSNLAEDSFTLMAHFGF